MADRASAFAVLGLEPGADSAAVEQAYRRLIKQYHPDREGGDAGRAAEIIHAYRELRGGKALSDPLQFNDHLRPRRRRRYWPLVAGVAGAALGGALLMMGPSVPITQQAAAGANIPIGRSAALSAHDPIGAPLHVEAIDRAIRRAHHLYRTKDEWALAKASRDCHQHFRNDPGTELLDSCAAFDDAVAGLENRDPLRDGGPFAPLAVTGRQWSAATTLSGDFLGIDSRLDRIRLRVELAMEAPTAVSAPQPSED
jgi:curved DNA-binding protein CbpA